MCTFCTYGAVESEKTFHFGCDALKDIGESYGSMLPSVSWHYLFSEEIEHEND